MVVIWNGHPVGFLLKRGLLFLNAFARKILFQRAYFKLTPGFIYFLYESFSWVKNKG